MELCSCYYQCESGVCVQFPGSSCGCDDPKYHNCEEFVQQVEYEFACDGVPRSNKHSCGRYGSCVEENVCECDLFFVPNGEQICEFFIWYYLKENLKTSIWVVLTVIFAVLLVAIIIFVYVFISLGYRELDKVLDKIKEKKKRREQISHIAYTLYQLRSTVSCFDKNEVIRNKLNKLTRLIGLENEFHMFSELKRIKLIVKIIDEMLKVCEKEDSVTDKMKNELIRKFVIFSKKKFSVEGKILSICESILKNFKKKLPFIKKTDIVVHLEFETNLKRISQRKTEIATENKLLKTREEKLKSVEVSVDSVGEPLSLSEREISIMGENLDKNLVKSAMKSVKDDVPLLDVDSVAVSFTQKENYFKKVEIDSKNKWKSYYLQKVEEIQNECEDLITKIGENIAKNSDTEVFYWCTVLRSKIPGIDLDTPLAVLKSLSSHMQLVLDKNENNIDKVIKPLLEIIAYVVQVVYFRQKENNIKMNIEEKEILLKRVKIFQGKYGRNDFLVKFYLSVIKEGLLVIEDTDKFMTKFLAAISVTKPGKLINLIREKVNEFQSPSSWYNRKPWYIDFLHLELLYHLNPLDLDQFVGFKKKNKSLNMHKINILSRYCFDMLGKDEALSEYVGQPLKIGLETSDLTSSLSILDFDKEAIQELEEKPSTTTEVVEIKDEKTPPQKSKVYKKPLSLGMIYQLVNFMRSWNSIQGFNEYKTDSIKLYSMKVSAELAAKMEKIVDWAVAKRRNRKKKKVMEHISKYELMQEQYSLYQKYLTEIIVNQKFLDLKIPVSINPEFLSFNKGEELSELYKIVDRDRYLAFVGEGGSGKSCAIYHLCHRLHYEKNLFCFFIRGSTFASFFKTWKDGKADKKIEILIECIIQAFESKFYDVFSSIDMVEFKMQLKQILNKQQIALMIDAFDEISVIDRSSFCNLLNLLVDEKDINFQKIFMTSRPELFHTHVTYFDKFFPLYLDSLSNNRSLVLVRNLLAHNNKEGEERDKIITRFLNILKIKTDEGNPLVNVLLLKRLLTTDESDDEEIMNNPFVLYESLLHGSLEHDRSKFKNEEDSVAQASISFCMNLLSIIGYLNHRLNNPTKTQIISVLNQNFDLVLDKEFWLKHYRSPIEYIVKSIVRVSSSLSENKNYLIFSHQKIQEFFTARFIVEDKSKSIELLRKIFNNDKNLYFSFFKLDDPIWINVFKFIFNYFSPKNSSFDSFPHAYDVANIKMGHETSRFFYEMIKLGLENCTYSKKGLLDSDYDVIFTKLLEKGVSGGDNLHSIYVDNKKKFGGDFKLCYYGNRFDYSKFVFNFGDNRKTKYFLKGFINPKKGENLLIVRCEMRTENPKDGLVCLNVKTKKFSQYPFKVVINNYQREFCVPVVGLYNAAKNLHFCLHSESYERFELWDMVKKEVVKKFDQSWKKDYYLFKPQCIVYDSIAKKSDLVHTFGFVKKVKKMKFFSMCVVAHSIKTGKFVKMIQIGETTLQPNDIPIADFFLFDEKTAIVTYQHGVVRIGLEKTDMRIIFEKRKYNFNFIGYFRDKYFDKIVLTDYNRKMRICKIHPQKMELEFVSEYNHCKKIVMGTLLDNTRIVVSDTKEYYVINYMDRSIEKVFCCKRNVRSFDAAVSYNRKSLYMLCENGGENSIHKFPLNFRSKYEISPRKNLFFFKNRKGLEQYDKKLFSQSSKIALKDHDMVLNFNQKELNFISFQTHFTSFSTYHNVGVIFGKKKILYYSLAMRLGQRQKELKVGKVVEIPEKFIGGKFFQWGKHYCVLKDGKFFVVNGENKIVKEVNDFGKKFLDLGKKVDDLRTLEFNWFGGDKKYFFMCNGDGCCFLKEYSYEVLHKMKFKNKASKEKQRVMLNVMHFEKKRTILLSFMDFGNQKTGLLKIKYDFDGKKFSDELVEAKELGKFPNMCKYSDEEVLFYSQTSIYIMNVFKKNEKGAYKEELFRSLNVYGIKSILGIDDFFLMDSLRIYHKQIDGKGIAIHDEVVRLLSLNKRLKYGVRTKEFIEEKPPAKSWVVYGDSFENSTSLLAYTLDNELVHINLNLRFFLFLHLLKENKVCVLWDGKHEEEKMMKDFIDMDVFIEIKNLLKSSESYQRNYMEQIKVALKKLKKE